MVVVGRADCGKRVGLPTLLEEDQRERWPSPSSASAWNFRNLWESKQWLLGMGSIVRFDQMLNTVN